MASPLSPEERAAIWDAAYAARIPRACEALEAILNEGVTPPSSENDFASVLKAYERAGRCLGDVVEPLLHFIADLPSPPTRWPISRRIEFAHAGISFAERVGATTFVDAYGASTNVEYEEREDAVVLKTSLIVRKDARARSSARPVTLAFIHKGATLDFTHEVQFVRQLIEVELPECREEYIAWQAKE